MEGIDISTLVYVLFSMAGLICTSIVGVFFWSLQKHLEMLNNNTIAVAVLATEVKNLKDEFEKFRTNAA